MKILGRILLVIGLILTVFTAFLVVTTGHIAGIDPIKINDPGKLTFYWSPITAISFLVAGLAILIIRKKERRRSAHRYFRYYH